MLKVEGFGDEHEKFRRLCALSVSHCLEPIEVSELRSHLESCEECRELLVQYRIIASGGIAALAEQYSPDSVDVPANPAFDESSARERLMSAVRAGQKTVHSTTLVTLPTQSPVRRNISAYPALKLAIAAGLILAIAIGAYHLGTRRPTPTTTNLTASYVQDRLQRLAEQKQDADKTLATQTDRLEQLEADNSAKELQLTKLRADLRAMEDRENGLQAASGQSEAQYRSIAQQRDALSAQLQTLSQSYEAQKSELAILRSEHDKSAARTASLEAKLDDLTAANRDQERQLKDAQQYLTSDKDIRELMGARKLYIADVFDVDGSSRTQKPFGRVFYTQGKSLIFYAFDLDREPGVVNASTFQVWGQRETPQGEQASPMNLGILYRDSESNRRWVMRFDEQKQLTDIDAVFVTVEPHGGSHKPTSKPFLYALLRNEANHP
jgi:hypothetical protein